MFDQEGTGTILIGNRMVRNHILLGPEHKKHVPDYALECKQKLSADRPAQTILCMSAVKHYSLGRCITDYP